MDAPLVQAKIRVPVLRGLVRQRLVETLSEAWDHRITLLLAPAGSGKTTALSQFAGGLGQPTAWYRAETEDAAPERMLAYVGAAVKAAYPEVSSEWVSAADASASLERHTSGPILLVIDDFHTLVGTAAESELIRLADYAPHSFHLLLASRLQPFANLTRHRVNGVMLVIGADALRFRSWEVETLFRDVYGARMPPDLLAELSRRSDGWAAALQLFHLASRGKTVDGCRRLVASLGRESRLMTEYLARNVLDDLPQELAGFMLDTCVLPRPTGPLCDELLGRSGSGETLRTLERASLFTTNLDDAETFRYHEVVRSHLEGLLVEQEGEGPVRARFGAAAELLERRLHPSDALIGYCRAERWDDVARLLRSQGEQVAEDHSLTIQALPPSVRDSDPWLLLASARRCLANGQLAEAAQAYRVAESLFGKSSGGDIARRERFNLAAWQEPAPNATHPWTAVLRAATRRDPGAAADAAMALGGPGARLSVGLCHLMAGQVNDAGKVLEVLSDDPSTPPAVVMAARLGSFVVELVSARPGTPSDAMDLAEACEGLALPWLGRLARTTCKARPQETAQALLDFGRDGDVLGGALGAVLAAFVGIWSGSPRPPEETAHAARCLDELGLPVLGAWGWSLGSLASAGSAGASETARTAESAARAVANPGAMALASWALAQSADRRAADARIVAEDWAAETGVVLPGITASMPAPASFTGGLMVRCFGPFRIERDGRAIDLMLLKPRARSLLRFLAANANRPVHREQLIETLWPEGDPAAGARNLQVALSSIRGLLEPEEGRGERTMIARSGDSYCLSLPDAERVDHLRFEQLLLEARAEVDVDSDRAAALLSAALDLYTDEFLPQDGPAEWAVRARERYRLEAADASESLGRLHATAGRAPEAVASCERGLRIDPYRDSLWRLLLDAHKAAGNLAAAERTRQHYLAVLSELGFDAKAPELVLYSARG